MDGQSPNTIRFARFKPPTVSVGYFQSVNEHIDVDMCKRLDIGIARRLIGGGAAYEDYRGELTYGVCVKLPHPRIPVDFVPSYRALSEGVIIGLQRFGLPASFAGVNDVVVNGKKIGGVGQCRFRDALLQEGSILFDDMPDMFKVLKISESKLRDKGFSRHEDRMTNIKRELGERIDPTILMRHLTKGFEEALRIKLESRELTDREKKMIGSLSEKYHSQEWIYRK